MFAAGKSAGGGQLPLSWGGNSFGQLGIGNTTNKNSPVQISRLFGASILDGAYGSFAFAIQTDGTLWAWGSNGAGNLGIGSTTQQTSPVQVGTDTNWSRVSGGGAHTLALKTTGSLWVWGDNTYGQLGLGSTGGSYTSPTQLGSGTDWAAIATGDLHSLAIKSDGTLWAWGFNASGQVGNGNTTSPQPSPVQVGTDTNWVSVAAGQDHSLAIKSNGTLWAWGANSSGQLGIGTTSSSQTTPIQVGTDTNWVSVVGGATFTIALKSTGELWAWGSNGFGALGIGSSGGTYTSPVQVGTDTNWASVASGQYYSLAVKTTGTLWAWGYNLSGQLGIGNNTDQNSPVQVGTSNGWSAVSAGGISGYGILS